MAGDGESMLGGFGNAIGSGISTAATDVGNVASGIGSDIMGGFNWAENGLSSLFGGSTPQAQSQTGPMASAGQVTGSAAPMGAGGGMGMSPGISAAGSAMSLPNGDGSSSSGINLNPGSGNGGGFDATSMNTMMQQDFSAPTQGSGIDLFAGNPVLQKAIASMPTTFDPSSVTPQSLLSPGASGSPGSSGGPQDFQSLLSGVTGTKPDLLQQLGITPKLALPAAVTGLSLILNGRTPSEVKALQGQANQQETAAAAGQNLYSTAMEGQLPGPAMQALTQQQEAAKAQIRAHYASVGMSGSSAEAEDIANLSSTFLTDQFSIGQQMAQSGLNEFNTASTAASSLLQKILEAQTSQGTAMGNSLTGLSTALARGSATTGG